MVATKVHKNYQAAASIPLALMITSSAIDRRNCGYCTLMVGVAKTVSIAMRINIKSVRIYPLMGIVRARIYHLSYSSLILYNVQLRLLPKIVVLLFLFNTCNFRVSALLTLVSRKFQQIKLTASNNVLASIAQLPLGEVTDVSLLSLLLCTITT